MEVIKPQIAYGTPRRRRINADVQSGSSEDEHSDTIRGARRVNDGLVKFANDFLMLFTKPEEVKDHLTLLQHVQGMTFMCVLAVKHTKELEPYLIVSVPIMRCQPIDG